MFRKGVSSRAVLGDKSPVLVLQLVGKGSFFYYFYSLLKVVFKKESSIKSVMLG